MAVEAAGLGSARAASQAVGVQVGRRGRSEPGFAHGGEVREQRTVEERVPHLARRPRCIRRRNPFGKLATSVLQMVIPR
jgi:hypothetical protein